MKKKIDALRTKVLRPLQVRLARKVCAGATTPLPRPFIYPCYGVPVLGDDSLR